jgi:hypothetical protein
MDSAHTGRFIRERKDCNCSSTAEPGNRWLGAEVKAEAFYWVKVRFRWALSIGRGFVHSGCLL